MPFWQLTLPPPRTAKTRSPTPLELGALGVVEEEIPGVPPRLRAFSPRACRPPGCSRRFGLPGVTPFPRLPVESHATDITPLLDEAGPAPGSSPSRPARSAAPPRTPAVDRAARGLGPLYRDHRAGTRLRHPAPRHHGGLSRAGRGSAGGHADARHARHRDRHRDLAVRRSSSARQRARIDVDPDAVSATQVNAGRNGCAA